MEGRIGRRGMLSLVAGAAAAAVLAACGGETTATNTPSGAAATVGGAKTAAPTLAGGTGGQTPAPSGHIDERYRWGKLRHPPRQPRSRRLRVVAPLPPHQAVLRPCLS